MKLVTHQSLSHDDNSHIPQLDGNLSIADSESVSSEFPECQYIPVIVNFRPAQQSTTHVQGSNLKNLISIKRKSHRLVEASLLPTVINLNND